ncbi:MAG: hypothetical protein AAFO85_22060 [Cyanobacteria bacterium J06598_4]
MRRFLGIAFDNPVSLLDYLPDNTIVAVDELEQCQAHGDRWLELAEMQLNNLSQSLPKVHLEFSNRLEPLCFCQTIREFKVYFR